MGKGYISDIRSLSEMRGNIVTTAEQYRELLKSIRAKWQQYITDSSLTSDAIEASRAYIASVHLPILDRIDTVLQMHEQNCQSYMGAHVALDGATNAHIELDYLTEKLDYLNVDLNDFKGEEFNIRGIIQGISDLVAVGIPRLDGTVEAYQRGMRKISRLMQDLEETERHHASSDFETSDGDIAAIRNAIRSYRYNTHDIVTTAIGIALNGAGPIDLMDQRINASVVEFNNKQEERIGNHELVKEFYEKAEQERKDREEEAKIINGCVWLAVTVVSVATVGLGTGPCIAIGAATTAVTYGVKHFTGEYVEYGNLVENADLVDWEEGGKQIVIGGVVGAVKGGVKSGMKYAYKNWTSDYTAMTQHSNFWIRAGSNAGVSMTTDTVAGIASRGTESMLSTTFEKGLGEGILQGAVDGFDLKKMTKDAAGSAVGSFAGDALGESVFSKFNQSNSLPKQVIGNGLSSAGGEVAGGMVERFTETGLEDQDFGKAIKDALDTSEIAKDAIKGGMSGARSGFDAAAKQHDAENMAKQMNSQHNVQQVIEQKNLENVKITEHGGVDYKDSEYIFRSDNGKPVQVTITTNGDRIKDIDAANELAAKEYGVNANNAITDVDGSRYVWVAMDDFDSKTNSMTMQLVMADKADGVQGADGSMMFDYVYKGKYVNANNEEVKFDSKIKMTSVQKREYFRSELFKP